MSIESVVKKFHNASQVKCQVGYRWDPSNPTQDPALGGGIPPFPPGIKIWSHLGSHIWCGNPASHQDLRWDFYIPPRSLGGTYAFYLGSYSGFTYPT